MAMAESIRSSLPLFNKLLRPDFFPTHGSILQRTLLCPQALLALVLPTLHICCNFIEPTYNTLLLIQFPALICNVMVNQSYIIHLYPSLNWENVVFELTGRSQEVVPLDPSKNIHSL
ncbi:hypothetical protein SLEP1_g23800 [Rubroshorea leprosula]|uniref:Uncharacterized protein n=1 Tax=Rubroshorea leprosula TaxID=152421 RepID=A0AAV5JKS7_9ROSI|nr:hypothetical protein SLEP1_g23800 [Rubroshorea leprosula]